MISTPCSLSNRLVQPRPAAETSSMANTDASSWCPRPASPVAGNNEQTTTSRSIQQRAHKPLRIASPALGQTTNNKHHWLASALCNSATHYASQPQLFVDAARVAQVNQLNQIREGTPAIGAHLARSKLQHTRSAAIGGDRCRSRYQHHRRNKSQSMQVSSFLKQLRDSKKQNNSQLIGAAAHKQVNEDTSSGVGQQQPEKLCSWDLASDEDDDDEVDVDDDEREQYAHYHRGEANVIDHEQDHFDVLCHCNASPYATLSATAPHHRAAYFNSLTHHSQQAHQQHCAARLIGTNKRLVASSSTDCLEHHYDSYEDEDSVTSSASSCASGSENSDDDHQHPQRANNANYCASMSSFVDHHQHNNNSQEQQHTSSSSASAGAKHARRQRAATNGSHKHNYLISTNRRVPSIYHHHHHHSLDDYTSEAAANYGLEQPRYHPHHHQLGYYEPDDGSEHLSLQLFVESPSEPAADGRRAQICHQLPVTLEQLQASRQSCWLCGCDWRENHVSLDCSECGGYALERPCPQCDGQCKQVWRRNLAASHDCHKALWLGSCGLGAASHDKLHNNNNHHPNHHHHQNHLSADHAAGLAQRRAAPEVDELERRLAQGARLSDAPASHSSCSSPSSMGETVMTSHSAASAASAASASSPASGRSDTSSSTSSSA